MQLSLSDEDARTLRDLLSDHLRDLRLEVARTEAKDFRHVMLLRQELVERLLAQLEREVPATTPPLPSRKST
jgi:hypothetical protein